GLINVPWWQRWVEAACLPYQIIYENVDSTELETYLQGMVPGQVFHGLSFPPEVTDSSGFLTGFFAGTEGYVLSAQAGAVIGTAAAAPTLAGARELRLHARYHDHTDMVPHPMNPREFLHLLFGNDSDEFTRHPLLLKINAVGLGQTGLE